MKTLDLPAKFYLEMAWPPRFTRDDKKFVLDVLRCFEMWAPSHRPPSAFSDKDVERAVKIWWDDETCRDCRPTDEEMQAMRKVLEAMFNGR